VAKTPAEGPSPRWVLGGAGAAFRSGPNGAGSKGGVAAGQQQGVREYVGPDIAPELEPGLVAELEVQSTEAPGTGRPRAAPRRSSRSCAPDPRARCRSPGRTDRRRCRRIPPVRSRPPPLYELCPEIHSGEPALPPRGRQVASATVSGFPSVSAPGWPGPDASARWRTWCRPWRRWCPPRPSSAGPAAARVVERRCRAPRRSARP
jgi:hypothetical protein